MKIDLKNKKVVVTGGGGFLGRHVVKKLEKEGVSDIVVPRFKNQDLRDRRVCEQVVKDANIVIHLAAQIGGIGFIQQFPGEIFYNNAIMGLEVIEASRKAGVEKFVTIGTVCEYPEITPLPFKEGSLWDGYPEETTAPYGMAKKILIVQADAYRQQYGFNAIHLLPVNLYGPDDNFDRKLSHVIPALIKRIIEAKDKNEDKVEIWGTGKATREFLYVEDAASGIVLATQNYNESLPVNLGIGVETPIKEVAELIINIVGFKGLIVWNSDKPDGQPRRQLDTTLAKSFGFEAKTDFREGLEKTIKWYMENYK